MIELQIGGMEDVILGAHDMCNARRKATVKKKTDVDKSWKKHPSKMWISLVFVLVAMFQRSNLYSLSLKSLHTSILNNRYTCHVLRCHVSMQNWSIQW